MQLLPPWEQKLFSVVSVPPGVILKTVPLSVVPAHPGRHLSGQDQIELGMLGVAFNLVTGSKIPAQFFALGTAPDPPPEMNCARVTVATWIPQGSDFDARAPCSMWSILHEYAGGLPASWLF